MFTNFYSNEIKYQKRPDFMIVNIDFNAFWALTNTWTKVKAQTA